MIINKDYTVKWHYSNVKHYTKLGYCFTRYFDEFKVNVFDLVPSSPLKIDVKCNFCEDSYFKKSFRAAIKQEKHFCCMTEECKKAHKMYNIGKTKKTMLDKYGVENPFQLNSVKEKIRQTNLKNTGYEYPSQCPKIREKAKETWIKNWGVDNPQKSKIVKEKTKQTCIELYGADNIWGSERGKEKIKETLLERYGVEYISQCPDIRKKVHQTMKNQSHGTGIDTSKLQENIWLAIGGELNYNPHFKEKPQCWLDIAFPNEKICIEVDGSGHFIYSKFMNLPKEQGIQRDLDREKIIFANNWKIIRIVEMTSRKISLCYIQENVDYAKNILKITNCNKVIINYDDNKIYYDGKEEDIIC